MVMRDSDEKGFQKVKPPMNDAEMINRIIEDHYKSENSPYHRMMNPGSRERNSKESDSGIREPK